MNNKRKLSLALRKPNCKWCVHAQSGYCSVYTNKQFLFLHDENVLVVASVFIFRAHMEEIRRFVL